MPRQPTCPCLIASSRYERNALETFQGGGDPGLIPSSDDDHLGDAAANDLLTTRG